MKTLTEYTKNGYRFTFYARAENIAIFHGIRQGGTCDNWEVVRIQSHQGREIAGKWFEPAEYPPGNEQWGTNGWTFTNPEDAKGRFELEVGKLVQIVAIL